MSKANLFLSLAAVLMFCSCLGSGRKIADVEELHAQDSIDSASDTLHLIVEDPEPPQAVDELFDDFFFTFVSKPSFQLSRISFPLQCNKQEGQEEISREEWQQFSRFSTQDFFSVIYDADEDIRVQKDTSINCVSVEWIYLQDDYVEAYTFRRFQSKWIMKDINVSHISDLPNGDFLKFYAHFVSDSTAQVEAIKVPLKLTLTDDADEDYQHDTLLNLSDWMEMRPELPIPTQALVNIDYGQPNESNWHKNLLMEGVGNGLLIKFRFRKEYGEWKLFGIEN